MPVSVTDSKWSPTHSYIHLYCVAIPTHPEIYVCCDDKDRTDDECHDDNDDDDDYDDDGNNVSSI